MWHMVVVGTNRPYLHTGWNQVGLLQACCVPFIQHVVMHIIHQCRMHLIAVGISGSTVGEWWGVMTQSVV